MTSYFEKLTSINSSSLNIVANRLQQQRDGSAPDISTALDKIEELKKLKTQLELDLKCEHDEKSDLVSLKVGLETEILELRETNERLEFQVEQLKTEKDKIHHVLARIREEAGSDNRGFIAGGGVMKKFPSLDDLSLPSSPGGDSSRVCITPTSSRHSLERIEEMDETLLESLVMTKPAEPEHDTTTPNQTSLDQLMKRISFLERENELLRSNVFCPKCKKKTKGGIIGPSSSSVIFEHDDEGLVLSAVDYEDEDESTPMEDDAGFSGESPQNAQNDNVEEQINTIVEMQRKIIEKLEREVYKADRVEVRSQVERMKVELEKEMERIVRIATARGLEELD